MPQVDIVPIFSEISWFLIFFYFLLFFFLSQNGFFIYLYQVLYFRTKYILNWKLKAKDILVKSNKLLSLRNIFRLDTWLNNIYFYNKMYLIGINVMEVFRNQNNFKKQRTILHKLYLSFYSLYFI